MFKTINQAIFLIGLSVIVFFIQKFKIIESENIGSLDIYNDFMMSYTIHAGSGVLSLITSAFMHGNIIHLFMNMLMLFILARMYLPYKSSFLKVYVVSLLLSSIFSFLYVNLIENAYVLGASGAIFGTFSYIFFKLRRQKEFYINFILFNIGLVALGMNIAWYSHLGGSIAGILCFYLENDIIPFIKRKKLRRL